MLIVNILLQLKDDIKYVKEKQFQKECRCIYLKIVGVSLLIELYLCIIENNWYFCMSGGGGIFELNSNYFVCLLIRYLILIFCEIFII